MVRRLLGSAGSPSTIHNEEEVDDELGYVYVCSSVSLQS